MMVDWLLKGVFSIVDHNSWTRNPVLNQPVEGQGLEHRSTDVRSSGLVPPNMCMAMESWLVVGLLCSDVIVQHQYLTCTQQNVQNFQRYLLKTAEQNTTALWPQQPWVGAKEKDAKVEMEKATEIAHDMPRHVMTPIVLDVWTSFQHHFGDGTTFPESCFSRLKMGTPTDPKTVGKPWPLTFPKLRNLPQETPGRAIWLW